MTVQARKYTFSNILLSIILMLFIISAAVILTLESRWLYDIDISGLNIEEYAEMPREEIRENYQALIDYNSPWGPDTLELPTLPMSETGRIHFAEVKQIFLMVWYLLGITAVLLAAGIWWMRRRSRGYLLLASILTIAVPGIIGMLIALNWERFFIGFHNVFFQNDYWLFDERTDPVIKLLPDTFFMHCAVLILFGIATGSFICFILYLIGKLRNLRERPAAVDNDRNTTGGNGCIAIDAENR